MCDVADAARLDGSWAWPADAEKRRFFKVEVAMPDGATAADAPGPVVGGEEANVLSTLVEHLRLPHKRGELWYNTPRCHNKERDDNMSYTLNVEPDIMHKAESYALRNGTTLDAMIRAYMIVIVSKDAMAMNDDSADAYVPQRRHVRIGSMRDEIDLPNDFDQKFEQLDAQVAAMFNEVS